MRMTVEEFRTEAARLRATRKRGAPRYSKEMQRWAVAYAKRAGVSISKAAAELGISDMTLRSWMRVIDVHESFAPVTITAEASHSTAATLTLTTAQGHVIGPLDLQTAAALVRALS
jgi:transposase-like protein